MLYLLSLYECWNLTKKIEQNREAGKEKGPSHSKWPSPRSLLEPTAQGFSHPHWDRQKKPERDPKTVSIVVQEVSHPMDLRSFSDQRHWSIWEALVEGFQYHPEKIHLCYLPPQRYSEVYTWESTCITTGSSNRDQWDDSCTRYNQEIQITP